MSKFRPRGITVLATLFVVTGLGLMLASLRIESDRTPTTSAAAADVTVPTLAAAAATRAATVPASDPAATRLFARAQAANRSLAYGGVKEVSRWTKGQQTTTVLTVDHVPGRGTIVVAGTGSPVVSSNATFSVEPAAAVESVMLDTLVRNYRLVAEPGAPLLGRSTELLEAYRTDDSVAARFWIDESTGLVLRRELVSADGTTAEIASYQKVDLAPHATGTPTAAPADVWSVVDDAGLARLRTEGWSIPATLNDGLALYQVREQSGTNGTTLQLSYTDGLVGLSVFQQRGVIDRDAMAGFVPVTASGGELWVRQGSLFYTWQSRPASGSSDGSRDIVVSVLADSASAPVGASLTAFPPLAASEAGVRDHLSRGVQRVGSWIDPLG